jgi:hypothetical protein
MICWLEPRTGAARRMAHDYRLYCRSGSRSGAESVQCVRWWVRVSIGVVPAERVFPVFQCSIKSITLTSGARPETSLTGEIECCPNALDGL